MESLDITSSGSGLLGLELPPESSSRTGPGGEDLSLSELSLSDYNAIMKQPFCLLAKPEPDPSTTKPDNSIPTPQVASPANKQGEELSDSEDGKKIEQQASKNREEKLQSDIFILKKLNASFELFNQALHETGSANDVRNHPCNQYLFSAYSFSLFV